MTTEAVAEIGIGTSNVRQKLVDSLAQFPNVKPTIDNTDVKIKEAFTIRTGYIGAIKEEGPPDFKLEKKDEHEHGKEVVAGVERLLQETFKGKNEFGIDNLAAEVFLRYSNLLRENFFEGNDELLYLLGETDPFDITKRSVLPSKGVPVEIGRAITVAVANRLLKTVRESSTQEAETIDNGYVETQKPILQITITQLEQSLTEKAKELAERQEAYEQSEQEKNRADKSFAELDESKSKAVEDISGKLKKPSTEISTEFSSENLQFITRTGLLKNTYSIKEGHFDRLDREVKNIFGSTNELKSFNVLTESGGNITIGIFEKLIDTHFLESSPNGDSLSIYTKAKNLLKDVLPNHDLDTVLEEQVIFFQKLNKSDQAAARSLAKGFLARALCLHLAKNLEKTIDDTQLLPIINGFRGGLTNFFEQTGKYKSLKEGKKQAKETYEVRKREYVETKSTHEILGRDLTSNQHHLEELDTKKEERIDSLRAKMVAELFVSTKGHVPSEEKFKNWRSYDLNQIVFQSKLLTDTVASIFKGLPICLPEQDRGSIIDNYLRSSYNTYQTVQVKEHFLKTVDYLPQLVKAILPEGYPNSDLATSFISTMIRDYPNKKHDFGSLLGIRTAFLDIFNEDRENRYYNYYVSSSRDIIQAILKGGEIVEISNTEVPRVNLQLLWDKKWEGEEAMRELREKANSFQKFLDGLDPESFVVSTQELVTPTKDSTTPIKCQVKDLLGLNPKELFSRRIHYFDKHPERGYEFAPFYVIKPAKPPESH